MRRSGGLASEHNGLDHPQDDPGNKPNNAGDQHRRNSAPGGFKIHRLPHGYHGGGQRPEKGRYYKQPSDERHKGKEIQHSGCMGESQHAPHFAQLVCVLPVRSILPPTR